MEQTPLINPDAILASLKATSKKQVLQKLAAHAARLTGAKEGDILNALLERERLGTTGIGHGVAIPHARLDGIDHVYGVFAQLADEVDFEAVDERPVDLVFLLLAPKTAGIDHLKALHRISRLFRDKALRAKLRGASDAAALYALLTQAQDWHGFDLGKLHSKAC